MSKYVIKLYVIDFIGCLGLESLQDDGELLFAHLHSEVVENGSETGEGNEARSALVLVLEVGLDEETSVLDIDAESLEACNQNLLFLIVEYVLRVEDRWRVESIRSSGWVLLKRFIGENGFQLVTKSDIVDEAAVVRHGKVLLKSVVLLRCQENSLTVENTSELLGG